MPTSPHYGVGIILQGMHNHGRYPIKFVGSGDYADGLLKRIVPA